MELSEQALEWIPLMHVMEDSEAGDLLILDLIMILSLATAYLLELQAILTLLEDWVLIKFC